MFRIVVKGGEMIGVMSLLQPHTPHPDLRKDKELTRPAEPPYKLQTPNTHKSLQALVTKDMDVYHGYNLATAGWLATQAVPLLASPKIIVSLLSQEASNATDLETYFARVASLALLALALLTLQLSGLIPTSMTGDADSGPYVVPTLVITTTYHTVAGIYMYLTWSHGGTAFVVVGALASAGLAVVGVWCLLFATDVGHISRRTGADKRTSGFPFKNDVAAEKKAGKKRL